MKMNGVDKTSDLYLITTPELMEELGIGKDKAYALMRSEGFPSMRVGKSYCVARGHLKKWIDDCVGKNIILNED